MNNMISTINLTGLMQEVKFLLVMMVVLVRLARHARLVNIHQSGTPTKSTLDTADCKKLAR